MTEGWVYVLFNPSLQKDLLKIGKTTMDPEERAKQLSSSSAVPTPYVVAYHRKVIDCSTAERLIHERLDARRYKRDREFFDRQAHLREAPAATITISMDKHLLDGGTLDQLLQWAAKDNERLGSNDFRSHSRIREHIRYRREHDHWVIEPNGLGEFKWVGYGDDVDQERLAEHMRRGENQPDSG